MSAASGGNSEPKQGQRSQSARGFCPRSTMRVPQPDIIEHFGNADAVPQPPKRCLSRQAGIVRCCHKAAERSIPFPTAFFQHVANDTVPYRAFHPRMDFKVLFYNFTSISPAPESDRPSPLSPNRAYRSSSSAPPPQNKRHVPPYLYHKVGTCRYIIMILSRQSHQAMQPSAKLLRLAFSFCWLRLAMISLLRPIRLVLKWKNGRSGTVKISTGRM